MLHHRKPHSSQYFKNQLATVKFRVSHSTYNLQLKNGLVNILTFPTYSPISSFLLYHQYDLYYPNEHNQLTAYIRTPCYCKMNISTHSLYINLMGSGMHSCHILHTRHISYPSTCNAPERIKVMLSFFKYKCRQSIWYFSNIR